LDDCDCAIRSRFVVLLAMVYLVMEAVSGYPRPTVAEI